MNKTASDVIYLLACTVNSLTPDTARVQAMDLEKLYTFCKWHTLRAAGHLVYAAERFRVEGHVPRKRYA